jgi:hypothetical protein
VITVLIKWPNDNTQEALLEGVPRVGDDVRLANNGDAPTLEVLHVLWMEVGRQPGPRVVVSVRPRSERRG